MIALGGAKMSLTNLCAAQGMLELHTIGRAASAVFLRRVAEAEMCQSYFVLGHVPSVLIVSCSDDS